MSGICRDWYLKWKERHNKYKDLWNTDKEECSKKITHHGVSHNAWRMIQISGAVDRMGGFANFSHYVNKCADTDYEVFQLQNSLLRKIMKKLDMKNGDQFMLYLEIQKVLEKVVDLEKDEMEYTEEKERE